MFNCRLRFLGLLLILVAAVVSSQDSASGIEVPAGNWQIEDLFEIETGSSYVNGNYLRIAQGPAADLPEEISLNIDGTGAIRMDDGSTVFLFHHIEKYENFGEPEHESLYLQTQGRRSVYLDFHRTDGRLYGLISDWVLDGRRVDLVFMAISD